MTNKQGKITLKIYLIANLNMSLLNFGENGLSENISVQNRINDLNFRTNIKRQQKPRSGEILVEKFYLYDNRRRAPTYKSNIYPGLYIRKAQCWLRCFDHATNNKATSFP